MDSFFSLSPDHVLDSVESALGCVEKGVRATGRTVPLNSIENRVYDIELDNGNSVVSKFYRPGRWSSEQILEEHDFMARLHAAEVPVVPPMKLQGSLTLAPTLARSSNDIMFAVFEKVRGRSLDELSENRLQELGRFLARLHASAKSMPESSTRLELNVETYGFEALDLLEQNGFLDDAMGERYIELADTLLDRIEPLLQDFDVQRIHGDCHLGNILWYQDHPLFVDFDDMVIAPPVQDVWMIVGGRDEFARKSRSKLLEAYEEMLPFDRRSLILIEPLRALRMIHYSGWIAKRWEDPSFPKMFPHFASEQWWQDEVEALHGTLEAIESGEITQHLDD